jgi:hypothetical protein
LAARLGVGAHALLQAAPILRRWLFEVGAPQALLPVALQVHETAAAAAAATAAGGAAASLSSDGRRYAFLGPLAALAVAIKLGYGLGLPGGGALAAPLPGLPPPPHDWHAWAASIVAASAAAPLGTPPSPAAAAGLAPARAAAYMAWLGAVVFPPVAAAAAASPRAAGEGGGGRGGRWDVAGMLARAAAAAAGPGPGPSPLSAGAAVAPKKRARLVGGGRRAAAAVTAWPYAVPVLADRHTAALPPIFAAVLTALAAHAWVRPAALHRAVAEVEAALLGAEAAVRAGGG